MSDTLDTSNDICPFLPFPKEFEPVSNLSKAAYAMNDTCARLTLLNATAAASGNLSRIRTPDFHEYIPAVNLAIVSSEESLPQCSNDGVQSPDQHYAHSTRDETPQGAKRDSGLG